MGDSVILPSLTDQMVLGVFKYIMEAELRKNIPGQAELQFGCQEGAIATIVLMFGETDDLASGIAHNNGGTWLQIVGEIKEQLQDWVEVLETNDAIDLESLQDAIDVAVNNYALKHPKKLGDALRINL